MTTQIITDGITLSQASWANDVDTATYSFLTGPAGTNTITATGPANLAYASGQFFRFIPAATNTGATTINVTPSGGAALGARNIFARGAALAGGELIIGIPAFIVDDGTRYHLLNANADQLPVNSQSAAYTTVLADRGKFLLHPTADNNPRTFTIDSNANVAYPIGTVLQFVNEINTLTVAITTDTLTLAPDNTTGSITIPAGGSAQALKVGATSWVIWRSVSSSVAITNGTKSTTTAGTAIGFVAIPAGVKELSISWVGLSASGTSQWIVQIGDSGGYEATVYEANVGGRGAEINSTIGFPLLSTAPVAASVYSGSLTLILQDASTNMWVVKSGNNAAVSGGPVWMQGYKALSATLDRIQLTTTGGADTFDINGGVNVQYQS